MYHQLKFSHSIAQYESVSRLKICEEYSTVPKSDREVIADFFRSGINLIDAAIKKMHKDNPNLYQD